MNELAIKNLVMIKEMLANSVKNVSGVNQNEINTKVVCVENAINDIIGIISDDYKEVENKLMELFVTDTIVVSDLEINYNGSRVDIIHINNDGRISIWAGDPYEDKWAEELFPSKNYKKKIFELIINSLTE